MYGHIYIYSKSMDQPGKVANNPERGQMNRENEYSPVSVRAPENLISRDGFGSPVSLFISMLRLNLVLTHGIPPEFRSGAHLFIILNCHTLSGQSRVYRVTAQLRTDGVHSLPRVHRHRSACLNFSREKNSAIPFPRRPWSRILCTDDLIVLHLLGTLNLILLFFREKSRFTGI